MTIDPTPHMTATATAPDEDGRGERCELAGWMRQPVAAAKSLLAIPHIATWAGLGLVTAGVGLIALAWGRTAGLTEVALQIPYVVSAGCTGLALVAVGLAVIGVAAKADDARQRTRQLRELRRLVEELRASLDPERES